jgi:hypothetical protein
MLSTYRVGARRAIAAFACAFFLGLAGFASADTVTLNQAKAAYGTDGGLNSDPVLDGSYNWVYTGTHVYVARQIFTNPYVQRDTRSAFDFVLPSALRQPNVVINSAILSLPISSETVNPTNTMTIHGIPSTAAAFIGDDLEVNNPLVTQTLTPQSCCAYAPRTFQVKDWVQSRRDGGFDRAAFMAAAGEVFGTHISIYSSATLVVDYTIVLGEPPTLDILAPAAGATFLQGDPVTFQAVASDAEDGSLDASIGWQSNRSGYIGVGPNVTTSTLLAGTHVITASVVDSAGNVTQRVLNITLEPTTNTPPTVNFIAPANGATFTQGQSIVFQGSAWDNEDGNLSGSIVWSSSLNGNLGTGWTVTRNNLSIGNHVITASVVDAAGNTTTSTRTIVVQAPVNTAPTVTISAPIAGASLTAGVGFGLSGTATDAQQGNMNSSLLWLLNGTTVLATGANGTANIANPGSYTITARVTDAGGLVGQHSVTVNVAAQQVTNYCALRGSNSSYEWIQSVRGGALTNVSGANGGYRDFTNITFNMAAGANSLTLTAGGNYTERWAVFIDLNRDKVFQASEQLFTTSGLGAVTGSVTIPSTVAAGPTRMRIVMSYGAAVPPSCGTFSYGEVEDYTVNIQTSGQPVPNYCSSRGNNTSIEWNQQFILNGVTRATGNNSGYLDQTSAAPLSLVRGSNSMWFYPGFASSTSYTEYWGVWIDFDRDGIFADTERVVDFGSSAYGTLMNFTVPTTAPAGTTRMRVTMKGVFGVTSPCEIFSHGEVEDHTVQLQ